MPLASYDTRWPKRSLRTHAAKYPSSNGNKAQPVNEPSGGRIHARVERGRWIADCPQLGCSGAEYVDLRNPVLFCCECRNAGFGHKLHEVVVPEEHRDIDRILSARPVPMNQNWFPGETIDMLLAENIEHGVET